MVSPRRVIGALGQVSALKVVSSGGVGAWRDAAIPRDSVGRALQAGTLVQGTVEPVGEKLRVQLRLVDGNSGVDLSGQRASFDMPAGDLLAVRDSLAGEVAQLIRKRLGEEIRVREQREGTRNVAAWSLVQRAQGLRKQGETAAKAGDVKGMMWAFHQADSLTAQAAQMDPQWADPLVLRGLLAYRRSYYLGQSDAQEAAPWIDSGMVHIGKAYALQPNNPDALEVRGSLRYWRWLLQLERDDAKAKALLTDAQNDLEQATRVNPSQAGAWATLSHLYYQTKTGVDVSIAARRALEADAYLDNADKILERLFLVSYDLGQFPDAAHWCDESSRRFPSNPMSVQCRLWMLTTKAQPPDVAAAWRYADSTVTLSSEQTRAYDRLYNDILVADVLARAGLGDSARRVLERSKGDPSVDPQGDLAFLAAFAYVLLGDKPKADRSAQDLPDLQPGPARVVQGRSWLVVPGSPERPRLSAVDGHRPLRCRRTCGIRSTTGAGRGGGRLRGAERDKRLYRKGLAGGRVFSGPQVVPCIKVAVCCPKLLTPMLRGPPNGLHVGSGSPSVQPWSAHACPSNDGPHRASRPYGLSGRPPSHRAHWAH